MYCSGLDARSSFSHSPSQLVESKPFSGHEEKDKLICCPECTSNFEREAGIFKSSHQKPSYLLGSGDANDMDRGLNLPSWLQQYRAENKKVKNKKIKIEHDIAKRNCMMSGHQTFEKSVDYAPKMVLVMAVLTI